ncbi:putative pyruvate decarboxylase [Aspergillus sclerotioniger CBS 115572]|uniref:Pyruvate decarboxylase n=1 Tax=Aspergillus sclerotioniger CBS 115572 TaxID=1450535 RepID=A0A317VLE6_9EURO|nr:putative pyruvate decarboxylase [Aspergillus sclerotioniger CBS 115572]PWY75194.1 putative pyruvate decarboxylase [Aspergillus sclerotioniger CBS 115572]
MTHTQPSSGTIKIAEYLLARLQQLGIRSIFGVPGDYNLRLLDFVEPAGLHWIGNCNELNAAYAADAYARVNGLSALITTYGVGELSAINGIAGAFTEKAGIIHIVGTPARDLQLARKKVHHTLADGDYRHFATMASHVTIAQANLMDPSTVPEQIDWTLQQAMIYSQPVYIELPDDMVDVTISASRLSTPISVPERLACPDEPLQEVLERIYKAQQPLILVDGECGSMRILDEVDELAKITGWPTWTTVFGKGLVNEELLNVYGHYNGSLGSKAWQAYFDSADLIIALGPHYTDTNTYNFTTIPRDEVSILLSKAMVQIGSRRYRDIPDGFLFRLLRRLDKDRVPKVQAPPRSTATENRNMIDHDTALVQKTFYSYVNRAFRPGDLILTETGTAAHGGRQFKLPPQSRLFGPATWLSIGYMLPATLGAAVAKRELSENANARAILFIGDGSLQMSVQEISTIIKEKLNVIIFIINNGGYTIERAIHGRKQSYNDIASWRHQHTIAFFGGTEEQSANSFSARTYAELDRILEDDRIQKGSGLRVVEVFMGQEDVEGALLKLMEDQISAEQP